MKKNWGLLLILSLCLMSCTAIDKIQSGLSSDGPQDNTGGLASESGALLFSDPEAGLVGLASYHQDLTVAFDGQKDGQSYQWSNSYSRDYDRQANGDFLLLKTSETGQADRERLIGSLDQAHYSRAAQSEPCLVNWGSLAEGAGEILNPASLLPAVSGAVEAGTESVNGIDSIHYRVNYTSEKNTLQGEAWMAQEGGYIVRYTLSIQGGESIFGQGVTGEKTFAYDLSQVNSRDEAVPPQGCESVLTDFPVYADAQNLRRLPNGVDYTSQAKPEELGQFYQDQLIKQGWMVVSLNTSIPQKPVLVLADVENNQSVSILLDASGGQSTWVSAIVRQWKLETNLTGSEATEIPEESQPAQAIATVDPAQSGLPEDIPLYPGVTNLMTFGEMVKADSADSPENISDFYNQQMPVLGWTKVLNNQMDGIHMSAWQKNGRSVNITVMPENGVTTLMILQSQD